ncbi:MAG: peptidoglycan DD-metalloendopeptidase family protein [Flavobacteriales bacterium]
MKSRPITYFVTSVLVFILSLGSFSTIAQSKTQKLKAKEERLKKQLEQTQELLNATKKSQKTTVSELNIINRQIAFKEELLVNLDNQLTETTNQISRNKNEIESLKKELVELKAEFKEMIRFAYKNRKKEYNVMYLFSSEDYNQAYRRMKYIEQYTDNRKKKAQEINTMQAKLGKENEELIANLEAKKELIVEYQEEKTKFVQVKQKQQVMLAEILADKKALQAKYDKQEKARQKIADAIRREIAKELARTKKKNSFKLSPEAKLASSSFEKNRGKLPWPVSRGTITKRFGKQRHSQVSSAFIQNNGIDISTLKSSSVRVVFGGTVTSIVTIPGSGQMVIVSHGAYRTVYSNLKTVSVKLNQKLKTKQTIGTLLPNASGTISESHFEIWKIAGGDMKPQNPASWLNRR